MQILPLELDAPRPSAAGHGFQRCRMAFAVLLLAASTTVARAAEEQRTQSVITLQFDLKQQEAANAETAKRIENTARDAAPLTKEKKLWQQEIAKAQAQLGNILPVLQGLADEENALNAKISKYNDDCAGRHYVKDLQARRCDPRYAELDREKAALAAKEAPVLAKTNSLMTAIDKITQRQATLDANLMRLEQWTAELKVELRKGEARVEQLRQSLASFCAPGRYTDEEAVYCMSKAWENPQQGLPPGHLLRPGGTELFGIRGADEVFPSPAQHDIRSPQVNVPPVGQGRPEDVIGKPITDFKPKPSIGPSQPPPPPQTK